MDDPTVIAIINAAEPGGVRCAYALAYENDPDVPDFAPKFAKFKDTLNRKIGINRADGMRVIFSHVFEEWS